MLTNILEIQMLFSSCVLVRLSTATYYTSLLYLVLNFQCGIRSQTWHPYYGAE